MIELEKNVIGYCPVCDNKLKVKTLSCSKCDTQISGSFTLTKFNYLTVDQLKFIEVFIKNRGSIKEVEKDLGVSYPTVRKMLDDTIRTLGYVPKNEVRVEKSDVLNQVKKGDLSVDEAVELLKNK